MFIRTLLFMCSLFSISIYAGCPFAESQAYESQTDSREEATYLLWDNQTKATVEDLLADPLLILRTSTRTIHVNDSLSDAWRRLAHLDFFSTEECPSLGCHPKPLHAKVQLCQDYESKIFPLLNIENTENHFDHVKPAFSIKASYPYEKVWWQISSSPDFSDIISSFDAVQDFCGTVIPTELQETFLENNCCYYFRAKGGSKQGWSSWSEPFAFSVSKPQPISNLHIEKRQDDGFELVWDSTPDLETCFLIFGSNSIDFIPLVYSNVQFDAFLDDLPALESPCDNLLDVTTETHWKIDNQRFAYYRVIAKCKDQLSKPSCLFAFHDGYPLPERDVLQVDLCQDVITRKSFPRAYEWLQKHTATDLGIQAKYVYNPYVDEETWNKLVPYFFPENFPEKAALDRIFSKRRVLSSVDSMRKAGFLIVTNHKEKIIVAKHSKLKGYLIKVYLDTSDAVDWMWWKKRIDGVNIIQESIERHGYQAFMKTPKKWIYPIPTEPSPKEGSFRKNFILVVQEMDILDSRKNRKAYKKEMTPEILNALYTIIMENLLIDSVYADNTPFCKDGKLAFIDTEHARDTTRPVPIASVAQYLSPEMYSYWEQLIVNGGPR